MEKALFRRVALTHGSRPYLMAVPIQRPTPICRTDYWSRPSTLSAGTLHLHGLPPQPDASAHDAHVRQRRRGPWLDVREFTPKSPPRSSGQRALQPGPYPPGWSRFHDYAGQPLVHSRYTFPPRSPDPTHLAVLDRPGFVRAASHPPQHLLAQAALNFNPAAATTRRWRSLTPIRTRSASWRTLTTWNASSTATASGSSSRIALA